MMMSSRICDHTAPQEWTSNMNGESDSEDKPSRTDLPPNSKSPRQSMTLIRAPVSGHESVKGVDFFVSVRRDFFILFCAVHHSTDSVRGIRIVNRSEKIQT